MSDKKITVEEWNNDDSRERLAGMFWTRPEQDHMDYATKNHVHFEGTPNVMLCGLKKHRHSIDGGADADEVMCKRCYAAMKKLGIHIPHRKD